MSQAHALSFDKTPRFLDRGSAPHLITLVLLAGSSALTLNIFLPSLTMMAAYFEADYAVMQLAVSAYLGLTGVLQLIVGPFADRYGRRPVLLGSFTMFLVATLGCIFSTSDTMFLAFRMAQAVIATGTVLSRAIVRDIFPTDKAASMLGYVAMGMAVMPMLGPVIGGMLESVFDWRASFAVLFAVAAIVTLIVFFDLPETNPNKNASFAGQFRQYPELFTSRRFWGYSFTAAFGAGCFFAFLGGAPYVAGEVLGMSPTSMGIAFGTISMGFMMGNFVAGRLSSRLGIQQMVLVGGLISINGPILSLILFLGGLVSPFSLFGPILLVGFGNGFTMPNAQAGLMSVNPKLSGTAAGMGGALMIGGGAILSALTGALVGWAGGAYPLILMILASAAGSIMAALYTRRVERQVAAEGA